MLPRGLPELAFFPALKLANDIHLGEWIVGSPGENVAWRSARFRELCSALLGSFAEQGFGAPPVVWHCERGVDGEPLNENVALAIWKAVRLATLDANDHISDGFNRGYYFNTSENAVIYLQPIVEADASITHRGGGFWRPRLVGGWTIGEKPLPLPETVSPTIKATRVSTKLAAAVFDACLSTTNPMYLRLAVALDWHAIALADSPAVTIQQRIIALKTAFEALLAEENSADCARQLRKLFDDVTHPYRDLLPWAGLLWSPKELTNLSRTYNSWGGKQKTCVRTEIEDWFMALTQARNTIIHQGLMPNLDYGPPSERPLSQYAGTLLEVGERVLREAFKAALGAEVLLCGLLGPRRRLEKLIADVEGGTVELIGEQDLEADGAEPREEAVEPEWNTRPLEELLRLLGCDAANKIWLRPAFGNTQKMWTAKFGGVELGINLEELAVLEASGAERELSKYFEMCE